MPRRPIRPALRARLAEAAHHRCGYCLAPESLIAIPLHVDHIIPIAEGGETIEANLWLACALCNGFKGWLIRAVDPETGVRGPLFNPRTDAWAAHFEWSEDGITILGKSAVGRATVEALRLNNEFMLRGRRRWVAAGWHPPGDS